jgi:hypothetical protein
MRDLRACRPDRYQLALLLALLMIGSGCGSGASKIAASKQVPRANRPMSVAVTVARLSHSVKIHFPAGRQSTNVTIAEPHGVILLYRIQAAAIRMRIQGTAQLPGSSAPLLIQTPGTSCHPTASLITCTQAEEWCPMPAGTWHVHLHKLGGPAGDVRIWLNLGQPPGQQADNAA